MSYRIYVNAETVCRSLPKPKRKPEIFTWRELYAMITAMQSMKECQRRIDKA